MHSQADGDFAVGVFGIGLDAYWPQFAGLQERLKGYIGRVAKILGQPGVKVVNLGLIDTPEKAFAAGHEFRRADVDLIFVYVTTYALSSTVLTSGQTRESSSGASESDTGRRDRLRIVQ